MEILIKNGYVFDPLNDINGDVMDIGVKDGRIVDPSEIDPSKAKVIDAKGKTVMAGAIDVHSHIAGPKVATGRLIKPEDHYLTNIPNRLPYRRAQTGVAVPNVFKIGYAYAEMGYTTVAEAATPPLKTRHTHEELNAIPIIDKMAFVLVDSNWIALDLIQEGDLEKLCAYYAWLLKATKCYALKLVDPGSDVAWVYGKPSLDLDNYVPGYNLTPRDIIETTGKASETLNLPHQIHVHCNRLGYPGNCVTTVKTLDLSNKFALRDRPSLHITHVQFTGYLGDSWADLRSGGEEIAKSLNKNRYATIDLGQVIPGFAAVTMTADAPFEYVLYHITRGKWSFADVEAETAAGIVPYRYRKKNYVNTIQWVIGLEITLLAEDLWRVYITTDHPNAGPFTGYPKIFSWLVSAKAREEIMKEMSSKALKRSALPAIDKELTLYDLAILTRASPAKLLGLEKEKGHLGIGAQADIAIYDIDPTKVDLSRDYEVVVRAFRKAAYTIKDGEIVVKDGEVVKTVYGTTYYVNPQIPEDLEREIESVVKEKFVSYYSVALDNFIIRREELKKSKEITVKAKLGG
ncbi:MAG: formylmethanofuran dehydrogenase subunit A [Thermoprotei archaeon]|nr:MAG: formylmethanofuran dehydrogenase subunit A [Thermoprotei archaeon]